MSKTVVVVPCYNEEQRLPVKEYLSFVESGAGELLFVNDGSTDGTGVVLEELCGRSGWIHSLSLPRNLGKAEAVRLGLLRAVQEGADVVAYLDADLSTPVTELDRLLIEQARSGADVVLGARVGLLGWDVKRAAHRHYFGRIFATAASLVLGLRVYDTQCGAKVFTTTEPLRRSLAEPFRSRWVFDVELLGRLVIEHEKMGSISDVFLEVPLQSWSDVGGSKLKGLAMVRAAIDLVLVRRDLRRWPQG